MEATRNDFLIFGDMFNVTITLNFPRTQLESDVNFMSTSFTAYESESFTLPMCNNHFAQVKCYLYHIRSNSWINLISNTIISLFLSTRYEVGQGKAVFEWSFKNTRFQMVPFEF